MLHPSISTESVERHRYFKRCFNSELSIDISRMSAQMSLTHSWSFSLFPMCPLAWLCLKMEFDCQGHLQSLLSPLCVWSSDLFLPPSLCTEHPPTQSAQKRIVQLWGACHHYTSSQQGGDSAATLHGWDVSPREWWHFPTQQGLEVQYRSEEELGCVRTLENINVSNNLKLFV